MAQLQEGTPLDVVAALKGTEHAEYAQALAAEFKAANIRFVEDVHNAPLRVKATHGADIYAVIGVLAKYRPVQVQTKRSAKEKDN